MQPARLLRKPRAGILYDTLFLVDRFHWSNHTGCSHAYNMALFPALRSLNSEVAEQRNSQLQPHKPMVSQMCSASPPRAEIGATT